MKRHRTFSSALGSAWLVVAALACGAPSGHPLRVGTETGHDAGLTDFGNRDGGVVGDGGIGRGEGALTVQVEDLKDIRRMTIELVTIQCSGECADVEAVAHGGHPPYAFRWEDGSTAAQRHVCPSETTQYAVRATDTAISDSEFAYAAHAATAKVTARVLSCTDAGASDAGPGGQLCLDNASLEGTAALNVVNNFALPSWTSCVTQGADVWSSSQSYNGQTAPSLAATNGATYVRMGGEGPFGDEDITQTLCEPMHAGTRYNVTLDLASESHQSFAEGLAFLEIWGASAACGQDELLWTSPITSTGWQAFCATLSPTQETTQLTLRPRTRAGDPQSILFVDNLTPAAVCP